MKERSVLFWDFDGVIKESVEVKTAAYVKLFAPFGAAVAERVREHHERNGGMSRFDKLPLYLQWARQPASDDEVQRYCDAFSGAVFQAVIDAPWVPGAREYLQRHHARQRFVQITATPQDEIERILAALQISSWFREVHGAPTAKAEAVAAVLARWGCEPDAALVIGDADADYRAAAANGVEFLLRRTPLNLALQREHAGRQCEHFLDE